jgi:hypothetical protein
VTSPDPDTLARDMIEAHGDDAVIVARENARRAAVSGRVDQAKLWLRIVGLIQRVRPGTSSSKAENHGERPD